MCNACHIRHLAVLQLIATTCLILNGKFWYHTRVIIRMTLKQFYLD